MPEVRFSALVNRIALISAILILLTSSFDIFLIVNAGGNYRFCQILILPLAFLGIMKRRRGAKIKVLGAAPLCIWLAFQIAFVPVTDFWPKSLGYCFWLLLNVGMMFSFVQLFGDRPTVLNTLLRWYVYSFALVAGLGIVQFLLPLLGFGSFFVEQWWIPEQLARANGFSYEPSYFATYLFIGFVFTSSLLRNSRKTEPTRQEVLRHTENYRGSGTVRLTIGPQVGSLPHADRAEAPVTARTLRIVCWITGIGIFLSSSRMGIVFLLLELLLSQIRPWLNFFSNLRRSRFTSRSMRPLVPSLLTITFMCCLSVGISAALEQTPALALMFLNGTGVSDTAAHSVVQREGALEETFSVFWQHPFLGTSLGGVSSGIADLQGEKITSFEDTKQFEGMSVFAEALAASGVIGIIPFIWFLIATLWKPLRLARMTNPLYSTLLRALVRSLFFAWMILQFNQNVLRPYLWTHLAILATVYAAALQSVKASACASGSSLSGNSE